jgi:methanogenic corrinoid protein MtbC1
VRDGGVEVRDVLERYTNAALAGARGVAAGIAAQALAAHGTPVPVITGLLAPSQREIGARWQHLQCSVGEEHAATFVTESVLASISVGFEAEPTKGTFVMACADGEWHGLPARMAAELLIHDGWNVVYLGPATPAIQLRAYLAGIEADVVGVSASLTSNLPGAARSVHVARRLGMPVVVGGAAFGGSEHRARAVGADALVDDLAGGLDLDAVVWDRVPEPDLAGEWSMIDARRVEIVRAVTRELQDESAARTSDASWARQLVAHVDDIVGVVVAAVLCDDVSIIRQHREWLGELVGANALSPEVAGIAYDTVCRVVATDSPTARVLIGAA